MHGKIFQIKTFTHEPSPSQQQAGATNAQIFPKK